MLRKIKEKFLNRQFLTFGIIGVINTGVALILNKFILMLGAEVGLASIISDVLAFIPSYFMNMTFTYKKKYSWKSFFAFPVSYIPGWIITFFIVEILSRGFGVPERWAKMVAVPIYVPVNYLVMSFIVKKTNSQDR